MGGSDGPPAGNPGPPAPGGGSAGFYVPYEATSSGTGETGLFVIPSDNLSAPPIFVTRTAAADGQSGITVLASSKKQALNSANIVTSVSPYALIYLANGSDGNAHVYAVTLADTSVAPKATQVSSLSLGSASDVCNVVGQAQTNVYDPTTLFVLLRTNAGGAASCGTGDVYQVVHYSDAPTAAPALVTLNVADSCLPIDGPLQTSPLAAFKALYQPGGALGGIVLLDSTGGTLTFYTDSTFTKSTALVSGVTTWCGLVDDSGVNNTGFVGASVAFLSVNTSAGTSVWRVTGAGADSASNVYTASGALGPDGVADANNVYFTDMTPLGTTKVYREPIGGGAPLELYETTAAGLPLPQLYSLVGSNGTTLVLTAVNISPGSVSTGLPGDPLSTSLLALSVGAPGAPKTIAGPFSGVVAASMCPAVWADATSGLVVINMQDIAIGLTSTYSYSSEVLTPEGTIRQPVLENSYFVSGSVAPAPPCGLEFGSLLQVRGITDTDGGYGGGTVNTFDLSSLAVTVLTTTTGSGSYSIPGGDAFVGDFLADNTGGGMVGSSPTSLGVALDLSRGLIVTVSVPNSSVTNAPLESAVPDCGLGGCVPGQ